MIEVAEIERQQEREEQEPTRLAEIKRGRATELRSSALEILRHFDLVEQSERFLSCPDGLALLELIPKPLTRESSTALSATLSREEGELFFEKVIDAKIVVGNELKRG